MAFRHNVVVNIKVYAHTAQYYIIYLLLQFIYNLKSHTPQNQWYALIVDSLFRNFIDINEYWSSVTYIA